MIILYMWAAVSGAFAAIVLLARYFDGANAQLTRGNGPLTRSVKVPAVMKWVILYVLMTLAMFLTPVWIPVDIVLHRCKKRGFTTSNERGGLNIYFGAESFRPPRPAPSDSVILPEEGQQ